MTTCKLPSETTKHEDSPWHRDAVYLANALVFS